MEMRQSRKARRVMRRCFSTPEIFERILLNLDIYDLLFAQLIHTHFKKFIEKSLNLQRKLFFAPDPLRKTPELHPILKRRFPALLSLKRPCDVRSFNDLNEIICKLDWYTDEFYRERMLREDASWRLMFPVQPPARLEVIKIFTHDDSLGRFGRCVPARLGSKYQGQQETGIRMGLLYDIVVHLNSANYDPMIYIHWQMFPTEKEESEDYSLNNLAGFEDLVQHGAGEHEIKNSITFYYQHQTFGGPVIKPKPLLKINSPFLSMMEENLTTLFEFLKNPEIEHTSWRNYLTADRAARIEERQRRRRRGNLQWG